MSAIEGATVACRTLQDGTLRITVDVDPPLAQQAFALFGAPGRGVALAALKDGRAAIEKPDPSQSRIRTERQQETTQANWGALGVNCKAAITWGSSPDYLAFIGAQSPEDAERHIKNVCRVKSRKELDTDAEAAERFARYVKAPFQRYMQARGME
jgi:hypothetical protein